MHDADPVGSGLAASLAHPGGNVTGLATLHADMAPKRLQLLKDIAPSAARVAVLLHPANPSHPLQLKDIQAAAPALGLTLLSVEVKGPDAIDRAFTKIRKERPGALLVLGDRMFLTHGRRLAELAVKSRLPAISTVRQYPENGLLMSYGTNFGDLYRRAATYVDKILKGAKPADLPIEQPMRFELVINLKTAKALGLTIPPSVLLRADHVIE
jgi:putative ABC transport system substrate-binding protein